MTTDELRQLAIGWYGERGWQSKLAASLGVDRATVSRWTQTGVIPGPVIAAVKCWSDNSCHPK